MEVKLNNCINEHLRIFGSISVGNINDVGLQNDGVLASFYGVKKLVDGGDGLVVAESVFAADNFEAEDTAAIIEEFEPLGGGGSGEARDDGDFSYASDGGPVTLGQSATFDEVFVALRVVEPPHVRPHVGGRGVDALGYEGGGGVGWGGVESVVGSD